SSFPGWSGAPPRQEPGLFNRERSVRHCAGLPSLAGKTVFRLDWSGSRRGGDFSTMNKRDHFVECWRTSLVFGNVILSGNMKTARERIRSLFSAREHQQFTKGANKRNGFPVAGP